MTSGIVSTACAARAAFVDQKDSDIVKRIGEEAGLTVHATNSKVVHPYLLQAGRTDLDFLIERARRIQFELVMLDGELSSDRWPMPPRRSSRSRSRMTCSTSSRACH